MRHACMLFAASVLFAAATRAEVPAGTPEGRGLDPQNLDAKVKPSQDFYQYANGGWLARTPLPPEYSRYGSFEELTEKNYHDLRQILEETAGATTAPKGSNIQKVGDFYASGMDSASAEAEGVTPLQDEFAEILAIKNISDIKPVLAHLHAQGVNPLFGIFVAQDPKNSTDEIIHLTQGGLGLPDRDYYTKDDERSKKIREEYVGHLTAMFTLLGDNPDRAVNEAKTVMNIETRLANASMTRVQQRDPNAVYHPMTMSELNDLTPSFVWNNYFEGIGRRGLGRINVRQPEFFKEVDRMITEVPLWQWKMYLRWHLIRETAPLLSSAFANENFRFYGAVLTGAKEMQPRWKRCLITTNGELGEALGLVYVQKFFSPRSKARALEMVNNLRAAFRERILTRKWMSAETRTRALAKLDAFNVKIGYPDVWRDYTGLIIDRGSFVRNVLRAEAFDFQRRLNKIGKPVDRTEWGMTPPTVNAYYSPTMNEIVFPAGILQPPFFDADADDAVNYGGMGAVIGHEMTHGFDDQGSQFDAKGNLEDWWTTADKEAFKQRTAVVEKQYDDYVAMDTLHVNGKLTLGENIADLGGLTIAYAALKKSQEGKPAPAAIDGLTADQRFFLAWAQMWRANYRPEELRRRLILDPHSPARFRTIGPVSNMTEFFSAFACSPGDPMERPEPVRALIW
jgi:putative endopeptidase